MSSYADFSVGAPVEDTAAPGGSIETRWERRRFGVKLVNPANKRKMHVIVVGTGLAGGAADANDTAAAIQALRAAGVTGGPIDRGVGFLRRHQNADGGFELTLGRGSDTQSTAWAIQALLAADRAPGTPAFRYLARMRRPDGSYRYNARYVTTPLWVTAQVLPALARKPFPLSRT